MTNSGRSSRVLFFLASISLSLLFIVGLSWVISASAHTLPKLTVSAVNNVHEVNPNSRLITSSFGPIAGMDYGLSIVGNEIFAGDSDVVGIEAISRGGALQRLIPQPYGVSPLGGDNIGELCPTPLAIGDYQALDLCIQMANFNPGATTLGLAADIVLSSTLTSVDSEIILYGNGYFVDGSDSYRVFDILTGGSLNAYDLTIQNGSASSGGGVHNAGMLYLTNSWVLSNTATLGGGIMNTISSTIVASNTYFISNTGTFGGGGIYNEGAGAVLNVTRATFLRNSAPSNGGGGLNNIDSASATLTNTHFISNTAGVDGGAINNTDVGLVTLIEGVLEDNYAAGSNGGAVFNSDVDSTVIVSGTLILSNTAGVDGGGIFNTDGAHLSLIGGNIRGNAANNGGGIQLDESASATIFGTTFISNTVSSTGGGISINSGAIAEVSGAVFLDNWANNGGAIVVNGDGSSVTLTNTHLLSNTVVLDGGGIYNANDANVLINASTIRGNTAAFGAGYAATNAAATLTDTSILYNNSTGDGGGLASESSGSISLIDSTVSDNSAAAAGGGILTRDSSSLNMVNSTLSGNSSTLEGGAILNEGSAVLANTTIASNTAAGGYGIANTGVMTVTSSIVAYSGGSGNCGGIIIDARYNLSSDDSCYFLNPTSFPQHDPFLGPLQDNGGDTWTHAPLYGSPVLNHIPVGLNGCGTAISADQRGVSRPQAGLCEIGAFESISYTLFVFNDGDGSGTVAGKGIDCGSVCSESYPETTYLTLTANADSGSSFDGWSGACTGTGPCAITMTETKSISASFRLNQHLLSAAVDGTGSGDVTRLAPTQGRDSPVGKAPVPEMAIASSP